MRDTYFYLKTLYGGRNLMNLRVFFISALMLLFYGCLQPMYDSPASQSMAKRMNSASSNADSEEATQSVLDEALEFCEASQGFWQKGEPENALDALDQAYAMILNVDTDENPELTQEKEDLRFMISKRILEIYASRNTVAKGKHNAIPVVMNKYVRAEIDFLTRAKGKEVSFFAQGYKRSGKYRSFIVEELEKAGLPPELSWLPLIESKFKEYALSNARALGLWQFIQSTGAKFGLKRDRYVDERLNPHKSTKAAVAYLAELHSIFGDWATVLAAYNCGEGRVLRVIREQNVNYLDNFWDLYKRLPRETARYVPRFMAMLHIVNNLEKYGFDKIKPDEPPKYEIVTLSKQVHLEQVARAVNVKKQTLKKLNPELRYNIVPGNLYPLRVPPNKGSLVAKLDNISGSSVSERSSQPPAMSYHRIKKGETLSGIARKYGVGVKGIRQMNKISRRGYIIAAGKILKIPVRGISSGRHKAKSISKRKQRKNRMAKHVVRKGDSLWDIAKRYKTTTKAIRSLNKLPGAKIKIKIGQVLKIP